MNQTTSRTRSALAAAAAAILVALRLHGYLLFHSFAEIFSATVAFAVFIIVWNTRERTGNGFFLVFGVGSLFVGIIDILHALAYRGMGIFPDSANLPTQLWIAARSLQGATLAAAPLFISRRPS
ncbi:MAG TPA: MASE3 domain-containing protein, partial [Verrucomicrobiae bacterium]|nr:MASE3 domain-containing protein [Verrucomicrobiae bacterium]